MGRTNRPSNTMKKFSISNDLTQLVNFLIQIPDCAAHTPALLDYFCLLTKDFTL